MLRGCFLTATTANWLISRCVAPFSGSAQSRIPGLSDLPSKHSFDSSTYSYSKQGGVLCMSHCCLHRSSLCTLLRVTDAVALHSNPVWRVYLQAWPRSAQLKIGRTSHVGAVLARPVHTTPGGQHVGPPPHVVNAQPCVLAIRLGMCAGHALLLKTCDAPVASTDRSMNSAVRYTTG